MAADSPPVIVLGGTGFLGHHIRNALRSAGHRVVCVTRRPPVDADAGAGRADEIVQLDLVAAEPAEIARVVADHQPRAVVNAAGQPWVKEPAEVERLQAGLVRRVLAGLAELPKPPRFVQLGSVHEYGPAVEPLLREDHPPQPVTPYGTAKLQATRAVLAASTGGGLEGVVLRVGNAIGPGLPPGSLLGTITAQLVRAAAALRAGREPEPLTLAPLRVRRDYLDARDVAEAAVLAATSPAAGGGPHVINIGSGTAVRVRQLVDRLVELSGLPVPVVDVPQPPGRTDVPSLRLDISRAERILGWRPVVPLDTSLKDTLARALDTGQAAPGGGRAV